jgi:ABC-2 type transport system ATP-binding protein
LLVGAPSVTLRYSGSVAPGERPERVFAQLVDDGTGLVIGNQVTPIPVVLDGATHETTVPLEMISFDARPGSTVTLQLVATTVAYGQPRLGGSVTFRSAKVSLPVVTGLRRG